MHCEGLEGDFRRRLRLLAATRASLQFLLRECEGRGRRAYAEAFGNTGHTPLWPADLKGVCSKNARLNEALETLNLARNARCMERFFRKFDRFAFLINYTEIVYNKLFKCMEKINIDPVVSLFRFAYNERAPRNQPGLLGGYGETNDTNETKNRAIAIAALAAARAGY